MLVNYIPYFILPVVWVMTFTNNRIRFNRVWSMVDGLGFGVIIVALGIFQLVWVLIDDIENAAPAVIFDFFVYRVIIAFAGVCTAWTIVSLYDLPGLPDLHHEAVADEIRMRRTRSGAGMDSDMSRVGEWFSAVFSHIGWYAIEIVQFLLLTLSPFWLLIGNPEDTGASTGAMITGMSLYAGTNFLVPILAYILLRILGGGPMYLPKATWKSLLFRRYMWWTVVNLLLVVIPAGLQMIFTHPGGWVSGNTSFLVWPFWAILIISGILMLFNIIVYFVAPSMRRNRKKFLDKYDAISEKQS